MEKKAYIAPATIIFQMNLADGILATLSGEGLTYKGDSIGDVISDSKGSGDWDIWGNGSDSDYEDDY